MTFQFFAFFSILGVRTSGFGDKGSFVVTDGGLGRDGPDRDLDVLQEMLNV